MLKTVKKVSSYSFCNKNVREIITTAPFGFIQQSSFGALTSRSQFRSFFLLSNGCLFNSTHHVLASVDNYHVPIEKANEMKHFWEDYTKKISFKRRCVNKVCTHLDCNEKDATAMVKEHPLLFLENIDNTLENIQLLTENGVSTDAVKQNIWILYFDNDDLNSRISAFGLWNVEGYGLNDFLGLFKLSPLEFQRMSNSFIEEKDRVPCGNRIVHMANLLQVTVPKLITRLVRHKYMLWRNIDLILASIKSYLEFGISGKDLVDDIWALRYTEPVIKRRLSIAKANNIRHMKSWFVRCPEESFEKLLENHKLEKSIIHPFETREEFLAHKLGLDVSVMKIVFERYEMFEKINIIKLVEMVDCLLAAGFKATDICSCCRIFDFSLETIMERINELKGLGVESISLSMLTTDQTKFRKLVERIEYINSLRRNPNIQ